MVHQCEVAMRHFISDKGEKRSSVKVFLNVEFSARFFTLFFYLHQKAL